MLEFNSIRMTLGLSWNEFYLCYLVQEQTKLMEHCPMSRNQLASNMGVSKQAVIDLVKKLDLLGYISNESMKLKCTDKWSSNFTEASEFSGFTGKETLPPANLYGKETLPLSNSSDKETLPVSGEGVKKLYHLPKYSGKETLPVESQEVKKLYQQQQETVVQNQENGQNGKETLPPDEKSDLYIYTKEYILNNSIKDIEEKGCGEKQKSKPYEITTDSTDIATCQVLRRSCLEYDATHQGLYSPEMYKKFINHWSALKNGKPAWYREKTRTKGTWDLPLRLSTWNQNDLNFKSKSNNGKSYERAGSALRPTSIAEPSKRVGDGNVAHVEF